MRWLFRAGAALLLVLGLATSAFAATPDGKTSATAMPLPKSLSASGVLTGSSVGAFAYYTFPYAGDGSTGTITLTISPGDPTTTNAFGVDLYQNGATLLSTNTVSPTPGSNYGLFSSATPGPVLVQVYNYNPGEAVSYSFTITGATVGTGASTSTTSTTAAPIATPARAASGAGMGGATAATAIALPKSMTATGLLQGSSVGGFTYYTFPYAGDGSTGTITLTISPSDPTTTNAFGVNVYQNGTTLLSTNTVSPTPGSNYGLFSSTTAGPILVQLYNYNPGENVQYTFSITGATP